MTTEQELARKQKIQAFDLDFYVVDRVGFEPTTPVLQRRV